MSDAFLLLDGGGMAPPTVTRRTGLVCGVGKCVEDDQGLFHPLGVTFFWALYGWKYERPRIVDHLTWIASKQYDYLRILGEVDWEGRSIDPRWPDYVTVLQEFVDYAYDEHGLRSEVTIVGGRQHDEHTGELRFVPTDLTRTVCLALEDRAHAIMHLEMANEWDRLDKVSMQDLIDMGAVATGASVNLCALSRPKKSDDEHDDSGYGAMKDATVDAGCNAYTLHTRRSDTDAGWSHVRQGYDFKDFPGPTSNNEPQGPQSSVETLDNPLQLACARLLGIICGGAFYVLHVGQGVTGEADPDHGRPQNMWEVPNIDEIMRVVRACDVLLPAGVENWKCVNNARDDHPLPLHPDRDFWEGDDPGPAVNKNYASYAGNEFVVMLTGCKAPGDGPVPAGTAIRACHVEAWDPVSLQLVASADLAAGQSWTVPGREDSMAGYLVRGRWT